MFASNEDNYTI